MLVRFSGLRRLDLAEEELGGTAAQVDAGLTDAG
jgi:hypothetical protein